MRDTDFEVDTELQLKTAYIRGMFVKALSGGIKPRMWQDWVNIVKSTPLTVINRDGSSEKS